MKRITFLLSFFVLVSGRSFSSPTPIPDEGMWLPMLLDRNYEDMKRLGLHLTPEEIYSINNGSLKDAIVIFGGGCTGEMISPEGLLLTNHHCGYGQIQEHSTVEHDYLKDGFWAMTRDEELINEGLSVKFLVRIEDVTKRVLKDVDDNMAPNERNAKIQEISDQIKNEATDGNHYIANVKSFFEGNEFYLFVYEEFLDVRMVGAPPSSIGKFGADTDNWMWPRHTGDFSMFRVYMGPDGNPAPYSKDNVPYKPKHYLPVSLKGVEKGDYAMIMGNPGSTERYLTSYGIDLALEKKNPSIVKIRTVKLNLMKEDMDADDAIRIKYATKYARTANYWKYFQGQTRGLKRLNVYAKKQMQEADFQKWVVDDNARVSKYGNVLQDFSEAYSVLKEYEIPSQYFFEAIYQGPEIINLAVQFRRLASYLGTENPEQDRIEELTNGIKEGLENRFKDYNLPTDKKIFAAMLEMYDNDVDARFHPDIFSTIKTKFKGDYDKYTEYVYKKTMFAYKDKLEAFLANPKLKTLQKDPAFNIMSKFVDVYIQVLTATRQANTKLGTASRLYIAGLREMNPDKFFYPDANFTMRLTYGSVLDYYPSDAVHYNYFTTLSGVMEKEDPDNWEFVVPDKLKELYNNKDFGQYGDVDAQGNKIMKVCFLTNLDITGGNSGSPVIDADGNLIGLAFDGNWEAMSGDIAFEPKLQRTISVDIRYVLFIIDKYAGAGHLIKEMTLVKPDVKKMNERATVGEDVPAN